MLNERIFKNKPNGVFVEIGAYDGIRYSNTKFFEDMLDWTGICIEPIPEYFEALQKNRPHSICVNACVAKEEGKALFQRIRSDSFFVEMLSGLIDKYDPKHLVRSHREIKEFGGSIELIEVDCVTLNSLLDKYNITHIDYLSIDTEGGELEILQSIDWDRFQIHVIEVENNYRSPEFREYLTNKGYTLIDEKNDEIYLLGSYE
jgi:FkbM family methyltransferase